MARRTRAWLQSVSLEPMVCHERGRAGALREAVPHSRRDSQTKKMRLKTDSVTRGKMVMMLGGDDADSSAE